MIDHLAAKLLTHHHIKQSSRYFTEKTVPTTWTPGVEMKTGDRCKVYQRQFITQWHQELCVECLFSEVCPGKGAGGKAFCA